MQISFLSRMCVCADDIYVRNTNIFEKNSKIYKISVNLYNIQKSRKSKHFSYILTREN